MEKILIISNYFPPETGAASNRIATLATGLHDKGWDVSVLCPLPNYPNGKIFSDYTGKIKYNTIENGIKINRIWVYPSNSKNKIVRLVSMLSFSFSLSVFLLFSKVPKKVIIQSPPLFVAFFAILVCKLKRKKIILNVSDLWPLAGKELGVMKEGLSFKFLEKIEKFNYNNSDLILGQSREICQHINHRVKTSTILYRNYPKFKINSNFIDNSSQEIHIVYAGLLGVAQGVVELCKNISLPKNVVLDIYGNGAEKADLIAFINQNPDKNIFYHGELSRTELHNVLTQKSDYAIIPLINRIYGSVPSKIFEMANKGLPLIYMGGGEGSELVTEFELGNVANPRDYEKLNKLLPELRKTTSNERDLIIKRALEHFSFDQQLKIIDLKLRDIF